MQFGVYLPNYGEGISARSLMELAAIAEQNGWDGFFLWDHILVSKNAGHPMVDPWVALAAMATVTERIRLGTTVTPVARRRPWKLARETVTLDHLSNGRLILAVGLGAPTKAEFAYFGEETDPRLRAERLDEGLDILAGLWSGKPFSYDGKHYQIDKIRFRPAAYQTPRIPVWVGGYWPNRGPLWRAARWDGFFSLKHGGSMQPKDIRDICVVLESQRGTGSPYDLVTMGRLAEQPLEEQRKRIRAWEESGVTWWMESFFAAGDVNDVTKRLEAGPPGA